MKKTLSILLAFALLLLCAVCAVGCGVYYVGYPESTSGGGQEAGNGTKDASDASGDPVSAETAAPVIRRDTKNPGVLPQLKAECVGKISGSLDLIAAGGGWVYMDANERYGVISRDGSRDSGARYAWIAPGDRAVVFSETSTELNYDDFSTLNTCGLVDYDGNVLIPAEYASVKILNDWYAEAVKAEERVKYGDERSLVYFSKNTELLHRADENDYFYAGTKYLYSLSGRRVVYTSHTDFSSDVSGRIVLVKDGNDRAAYNDKGNILTGVSSSSDIFANGTYQTTKNDKVQVLSADGTLMFTYKNTEFQIYDWYEDSGCYYGMPVSGNGFILFDEKGNALTGTIGNDYDFRALCGTTLLCSLYENGDFRYFVCDTQGNKLMQDEFEDGDYNPFTDCIYLHGDDGGRMLVISPDGKIAADVTVERTSYVQYEEGIIGKDNREPFYCYDTAEYSLSGEGIADFMIYDGDNVRDVITGNKLFADYQYGLYNEIGRDVYILGTDNVGDYLVYKVSAVR